MKRLQIGILIAVYFALSSAFANEDSWFRDFLKSMKVNIGDVQKRFTWQSFCAQHRDLADCRAYCETRSSLPECSADQISPEERETCQTAWDHFYKKEPVVIEFHFGFIDNEESLQSLHPVYKQVFIEHITSQKIDQYDCDSEPTAERVQACGFQRTDRMDEFYKDISMPDGSKRRVIVRVFAPKYPNKAEAKGDNAGQGRYNDCIADEQRSCFYIGHARNGGGPSFGPAFRKTNGSIDYARHTAITDKVNQLPAGLSQLKSAFAKSKGTGKGRIIGWLACSSTPKIAKFLRESAPDTGFISFPKETSFEGALVVGYEALDSILNQKCGSEFDARVNIKKTVVLSDLKEELGTVKTGLVGFFEPFKPKSLGPMPPNAIRRQEPQLIQPSSEPGPTFRVTPMPPREEPITH